MQRRRFGRLDVAIPVIGLGTWNMERDDRAQAIAARDLTGEVPWMRRMIDRHHARARRARSWPGCAAPG